MDQTKDMICRPSLFLSLPLLGSAYQSNTAQGKNPHCGTCVCAWTKGWKVCLPLSQASIYPFLQFISPPCIYNPFRSASRGGTWGKDIVRPRCCLLTLAQNSSERARDHARLQGHVSQQHTQTFTHCIKLNFCYK